VPVSDRKVFEEGGSASGAFELLASARRSKRIDQLEAERASVLAVEDVAASLGLRLPKLSGLARLEGKSAAAWARERG